MSGLDWNSREIAAWRQFVLMCLVHLHPLTVHEGVAMVQETPIQRRVMLSFFALSPFDDQGRVQMVVETPRGSSTKFKFDDQQGIFKVSRGLALGVAYPFDWGFVPGTSSDDGDALDAVCLHDQSSFPGIVLACRCRQCRSRGVAPDMSRGCR